MPVTEPDVLDRLAPPERLVAVTLAQLPPDQPTTSASLAATLAPTLGAYGLSYRVGHLAGQLERRGLVERSGYRTGPARWAPSARLRAIYARHVATQAATGPERLALPSPPGDERRYEPVPTFNALRDLLLTHATGSRWAVHMTVAGTSMHLYGTVAGLEECRESGRGSAGPDQELWIEVGSPSSQVVLSRRGFRGAVLDRLLSEVRVRLGGGYIAVEFGVDDE